jgi:hypothetical protein
MNLARVERIETANVHDITSIALLYTGSTNNTGLRKNLKPDTNTMKMTKK